MGIEKQGSKGGNYVGGFLQMFDWNAKSRKKLFSSKSDVPEQSKQKKRCDGNLPITRLQMLDVDEMATASSIKGGSDYSCASSVTDEDFYGTSAPSVVARLMGLDSMPKSENYSTPLFDSQSLHDAFYQTKSREYFQDQTSNLRNVSEPKYQKVINRPIEKFQTEMLPPKSARSIPITHHKLLSPIKSGSFIPPKDAAHIMEAAARIIEPGPHLGRKTNMPLVGSSSVPLRVRDLKEKVQAAQKQPLKVFEGSQRKAESNGVKALRGHSSNRSWSGSFDGASISVSADSEESSVGVKGKGKSISLALQAKANVLKREGQNGNYSRSHVSRKEPCELSPKQVFRSQSTKEKSTLKKPCVQNRSSSNVLRQNNQKQNCNFDGGKLPLKENSKGGKILNGELSSSTRQRSSSKVACSSSKASSSKLGAEVKADKREVSLSSSSERVTRKKRSIDGNYHSENSNQSDNLDKYGKVNQSNAITSRQSSWDQDNGRTGSDVISFTFTAPMTRLGSGTGRSTVAEENFKIFSESSQSKRLLLSSDGTSASRFSCIGLNNVKGGDALSTLLEQKLKELANKIEFSQYKSVPGPKGILSSNMLEAKDEMDMNNQEEALEESSMTDINTSQSRKLLDCRLPSPVSVLEHSIFTDSWNSSDTAETYSAGSKQCSSIQAQEVLDMYSSKPFLTIGGDADLSDSASSTSAKTMAKRKETNLIDPTRWEFEYVKEILCNIEVMFKDFTLGKAHDIIDPHLFDQLESRKRYLNDGDEVIPRINRRVMFDCVSECIQLKCRQYVGGGYTLWAKGLTVVKRKEKLAEEVYKEVSGWSAIGDSMIDEFVDKDMSSQCGRWLNSDVESFELGKQIESRILNSLIDEVVADMLFL